MRAAFPRRQGSPPGGSARRLIPSPAQGASGRPPWKVLPNPQARARSAVKSLARRTVMAAGVPVVPGTTEPVHDLDEAVRIANDIGYPVMIKASAGGGGKGMRRVESEAEVRAAVETAQREARGAFGS